MLKKRMATVIVVIALALGIALLFPACNKNKSGKESYDYSKILKGDLSEFAGTWVNNAGEKEQLNADGTFEFPRDGVKYWAENFRLYTAGAYIWSAGWTSTNGGGGGDFEAILFPVGIDVYNYSGEIVKSDKTKVRLHKGFTKFDELYYRETSGKAATPAQTAPYYATANLRLRSEPDTSKDNRIAGVPQGSKVEMLESGKTETIDNISAPWFKVKTEDGTVGWLFSGYLTSDPPASASYDYSKLLKGDFSDFSYTAGSWGAKDGSGKGRRFKADGTRIDDTTTADDDWVTQLRFYSIGDRGEYMGSIGEQNKKTGEGGGGAAARLYPIGVNIYYDDKLLQSDTTTVRLWTGQDSSPNTYVSELSYFRKK